MLLRIVHQAIQAKMVFTNTGVQEIIDYLDGTGSTPPSHIGVGTDSTTADTEDTTLYTEVGNRNSIDSTTSTSNSVTFSTLFLSTKLNGNTLREVGVFNASTNGDMFARFTHAALVKTANIEIQYDVTLKVNN